jgi:chloramphenicol 3-O-phosphotransferase
MEPARPTTLYLLCGKIAAGKSTLARRLAEHPATQLITMDPWMSILFPMRTGRLRILRVYLRDFALRWGRTLLTFYGKIFRLSLISQQIP